MKILRMSATFEHGDIIVEGEKAVKGYVDAMKKFESFIDTWRELYGEVCSSNFELLDNREV